MMHGLRVLKNPMSNSIVLSFFDAIERLKFVNSDALFIEKTCHQLQSIPIYGHYRFLFLQRPLAQHKSVDFFFLSITWKKLLDLLKGRRGYF